MVIALMLLLAGFAPAQTNEDARAVLQEIASSSRTAKSWLAEGTQVVDLTGPGMRIHDETRFKVAYQNPSKMLLEIETKETIGGMDPTPSGTLMVCDGIDHWTHYSPSNAFSRASVGVSACRPEFGEFSNVLDNLVSATWVGRDHVQFAGSAKECELVRAEYSAPSVPGDGSGAARSSRTLCIDPVQRLVLRDHVERGNSSDKLFVETTTYSSYARGTNLPADLLQFQVPTGCFEDDVHQQEQTVANGVYTMGMLDSIPILTSKIEPRYPAEAMQATVSGIVLVSLQVNPDGHPDKIEVVRGLGHGLDEKAVEAVRQWRFQPGTKDGVPVTVGPLKTAVSFRPHVACR